MGTSVNSSTSLTSSDVSFATTARGGSTVLKPFLIWGSHRQMILELLVHAISVDTLRFWEEPCLSIS